MDPKNKKTELEKKLKEHEAFYLERLNEFSTIDRKSFKLAYLGAIRNQIAESRVNPKIPNPFTKDIEQKLEEIASIAMSWENAGVILFAKRALETGRNKNHILKNGQIVGEGTDWNNEAAFAQDLSHAYMDEDDHKYRQTLLASEKTAEKYLGPIFEQFERSVDEVLKTIPSKEDRFTVIEGMGEKLEKIVAIKYDECRNG